ncbi:uncharacterized protein KY384_004010 [Bacidia gigantensis]|uniref:uncharacterized protein n=1 Tax=Bacidia gigantensis TaxID=2732470 RepID=UPI001D059423|nr:uncharacterized protein KY384_004010 [Bacidia gigantensis]KAG8530655.1 hypothetical protein KY384_004010 [Bacidia gigantensis]
MPLIKPPMDSMNHPREMQPYRDSAEECIAALEVLRERAQKEESSPSNTVQEKDVLLLVAIYQAEKTISSLRSVIVLTSSIEQVLGDSDGTSKLAALLDELFDTIPKTIADADAALAELLKSRQLRYLSKPFYASRLKQAERTINKSIVELASACKSITSVKEALDENEGRLRRLKTYNTLLRNLASLNPSDDPNLRETGLRMMWEEIPHWPDIEALLELRDDPGDGLVYNDKQIAQVQTVLENFHDAWVNTPALEGIQPPRNIRYLPRICCVLRGMRRENLLGAFIDSGCTDNDIRFSEAHLIEILSGFSKDYAKIFFTEQSRVKPRDWPEGSHAVFGEKEPLPLVADIPMTDTLHGHSLTSRNVQSGDRYVVKQTKLRGREMMKREMRNLKKLEHRHIVKFVKSFERGLIFGLLLKPAAAYDLNTYLRRFKQNKFYAKTGVRDASDGNEEAIQTAQIITNRYAAPELLGTIEKGCSEGFDNAYKTSRVGELRKQTKAGGEYTSSETRKLRAKEVDIFSLGCVFLELLSCITGDTLPILDEDGEKLSSFALQIHDVRAWAARKSSSDEFKELRDIFDLASAMINERAEERPDIDDIVQRIMEAGEFFSCKTCRYEYESDVRVTLMQPLINRIEQPEQKSETLTQRQESLMRENELQMGERRDSSEVDDDINSLFSVPSIGVSSFSSFSSIQHNDMQDEIEELSSLLIADNGILELLEMAINRPHARPKIESKLSRLLKVFGGDLRKEANDEIQVAAARLIRTKANKLTTSMLRNHELNRAGTDLNDATSGWETTNVDRTIKVQTKLYSILRTNPQAEEDNDGGDDDDNNDDDVWSRASSEEVDPDNDFDVGLKSLNDLKSFIISSQAFDHFRALLRRMVFPSPLREVKWVISKALSLPSKTYSVTFTVKWDVQAYIATELEHSRGLGWKQPLLSEQYYSLDVDDSYLVCRASDETPSLDPGDLSLECKASLTDIVDVAQQLTWLSASFRSCKQSHLCYSQVDFRKSGTYKFDINPLTLEEIHDLGGECWLPLFMNGVIARGFPVPSRHHGEKGIEIPFHVMVSLGKVMYPMFDSHGIYLKGVYSVFFPTAISSDKTSVQWHMSTDSNHKDYLPPGQFPNQVREGLTLKFESLEELSSAERTFLGYVRSIEAHIGTSSVVASESVRATMSSAAYDEDPATAVEINKIQTGTSGLGFWGFQAEADILYPKGLHYTAETGWYIDMLDIAKVRPLIVYDHAREHQRAWLIPTLSAVLHMAHVWGRDKRDVGLLPFAEVSCDPGEAAYQAIREHSKDKLRDSLEERKDYLVRDLVGRLLICIEKLLEVEAKARSEPRKIISFETSNKLYGWDLLGIAQGDGNISRQELSIDEEWRLLGADIAVLFCQNIGELIRPAQSVKICMRADAAKLSNNHLIATVKCLRWLSDKRGKSRDSSCLRLGNKLFWVSPGESLFNDCTSCWNNRLHLGVTQCLKQAQPILRKDCPDPKTGPPPLEGAVVFGTRKLLKARSPTPETSSLSQSQSSETQASSVSTPQSIDAVAGANENQTGIERGLDKGSSGRETT